MGLSSAGPSLFEPAKSSIATASSFAICFPLRKELQNERRTFSERKSALPFVACPRHHYPRCCTPHRPASLEFHSRRSHGLILRRNHKRPPPRVCVSAARAFCRRPVRWFLQIRRHSDGLRQPSSQRTDRPLAAKSPHGSANFRLHLSWCGPVFPGYQFLGLVASEFVSKNIRRFGRAKKGGGGNSQDREGTRLNSSHMSISY